MEGKIIINESIYKNYKLIEMINTVATIFDIADKQANKGIDTLLIVQELKSKGITLEIK